MTENRAIYHEKQSLQLCAIHALNNVFQERIFEKEAMDQVALAFCPPESSTWINPHKSMFGFGNYDINVIMKAVEMK